MTLHIFSAGSFRAALSDLAAAWQGETITSRCGPAGLLREAIENGEACDLYLSANAENVARLACRLPLRGQATIARNRLILTCRDDARTHNRDALQLLLDDMLRLATSTPQADPGGDYAWQVFDRIDALHPGAGAKLKARATTGRRARAKPRHSSRHPCQRLPYHPRLRQHQPRLRPLRGATRQYRGAARHPIAGQHRRYRLLHRRQSQRARRCLAPLADYPARAGDYPTARLFAAGRAGIKPHLHTPERSVCM